MKDAGLGLFCHTEWMTPPRLSTLTSLRFLFAAAVVAFHLLPLWDASFSAWPPAKAHLLNFACLALPFFFALSGFVLFYGYDQRPLPLAPFWGRRFARIAPVFYLSLALGLTQYLHEAPRAAGETARILAWNLSFLSAWVPSSLGINFSTWSISVEAFCYLLFPFLLPVLSRMSRKLAVAGMLVAFGFGAAIQLSAVWRYPQLLLWPWGGETLSPVLTSFLEVNPLVHFPEFLFGMFLSRAWSGRPAWLARWGDFNLGVSLLLILLLLVCGPAWPFLMLTSFLFLPPLALLLIGAAEERGRGLRWLAHPLAEKLGEASYAIYALHMPLAYWFARCLPVQSAPLAWFGGYFLLLTMLSLTVHEFLELPARRWLNRVWA